MTLPSPRRRNVAGGIAGAAYNIAEIAGRQVVGVANATYNAADVVFEGAGATMNAVSGTAEAAAASIGGAAQKAAGAATRPLKLDENGRILLAAKTVLHRYQNIVSPVVVGQGGDFGNLSPDQEAVILRIEVASSREVKIMRWISWFLLSLAMAATVSSLTTTLAFHYHYYPVQVVYSSVLYWI